MIVMPPLHPVIVHVPVVMIVFSFLFELAGRALDSEWWRKAALAMLVIGVLGAAAAVLTGKPAGEAAEKQGVAERAVDDHEDAGRIALWMSLAALAARAVASRAGRARAAVSVLYLAVHLCAAMAVTMASYRGGLLVYHHGAGVKVHGEKVPSDGPPKAEK